MKYISDCKLKFFIEHYLREIIYDLKSAQLKGLFKSESYFKGQYDILEKLSYDLNLKIDIDKLKG